MFYFLFQSYLKELLKKKNLFLMLQIVNVLAYVSVCIVATNNNWFKRIHKVLKCLYKYKFKSILLCLVETIFKNII